MTKIAIFREKEDTELVSFLQEMRKKQCIVYDLIHRGEEKRTHTLRSIRRDIARVLTIMQERRK